MKTKIVVTGDICLNTLLWTASPMNSAGLSWQSHNTVRLIKRPGEALLLADMISLSTKTPVVSPVVPNDGSADRLLLSFAELEAFHLEKEGRKYRVGRFLGFSGAPADAPAPVLLPVENDIPDAELVAIDDENNGFNNESAYWPSAIRDTAAKPAVLYKMNNPIGASDLWRHLEKYHLDRTVIIINADDLRSKGVNISRSLSWEKTSLDFVWQLNNNPNLSFLAGCRHLVIPFGLEGVIYYKNNGAAESYLFFLPSEFEGDFIQSMQGRMYGLTSCFAAGLAGAIAQREDTAELSDVVAGGIRNGMIAARKYFIEGFGSDPLSDSFPNPAIFEQTSEDKKLLDQIQDVKIHNIKSQGCQNCWFILKEKSTANLAEIALSIVKNGDERALKTIPTARFGRLKTVDRTEIESYRSIRNLIAEYVSAGDITRPLSIAVFGTPGSGKSYGVSEVASSVAPEIIKKITYNLSQFGSASELVKAFHKIRDYALEGFIPLIVFDEFDSSFEGKLGWLKYFLAPMQDGIFRDMEATHPIGKAIFVFAGGSSSTCAEFSGDTISDMQEFNSFNVEFRNAKGPDFISRLRGYVNILGPNQSDSRDHLFIIRRAMLLRALVERNLPHLINERDEAQIDSGVLRALLKVPRYKHESRSMEAIMEMSMLNNAKKWEQSFLPSREQLKLHVDENQFLRLMMHDAIFSEKLDVMAELLREKYRKKPDRIPMSGDEDTRSWKMLTDSQKEMFKEQIRHIPDALLRLQYDVIYSDDQPGDIIFTEQEKKALVQFELKRQHGQNRSLYTDDHDIRERTYQMVSLWPEVLAAAAFKIEHLTFVNLCDC